MQTINLLWCMMPYDFTFNISLGNGLSPVRYQAITQSNSDLLLN